MFGRPIMGRVCFTIVSREATARGRSPGPGRGAGRFEVKKKKEAVLWLLAGLGVVMIIRRSTSGPCSWPHSTRPGGRWHVRCFDPGPHWHMAPTGDQLGPAASSIITPFWPLSLSDRGLGVE